MIQKKGFFVLKFSSISLLFFFVNSAYKNLFKHYKNNYLYLSIICMCFEIFNPIVCCERAREERKEKHFKDHYNKNIFFIEFESV